ncbi:sulfur oxidation c-type cytochrome SoxX [Paracoccus sp. TK19116]|uniref:Sulfur oxidation c-type cytochrome SoxX n=1 Tax=Paracoccus albicereus TaxID=2922394 RepID=A0ABT1MXR5_9RHOB|nr:sulfur oxidation c-type cytochrome SoxX [Paracoccus albicereus]MCQ0972138.1 sulfur oxidation c-type cytochrome SoxX [Paracoccus albicereus]
MRHSTGLAALAIVFGTTFATATAFAETAPKDVAFDEYGEVAESLTGTAGDPESGAALMDRGKGNCIACHQVSDLSELPFQGDIGPSLDGAAGRWSEAQLRGIVVNAKNTFPDTMMPSFYHTGPYIRPGDGFTGKAPEGELPPILTAQAVEDVVAYLMTLTDEQN